MDARRLDAAVRRHARGHLPHHLPALSAPASIPDTPAGLRRGCRPSGVRWLVAGAALAGVLAAALAAPPGGQGADVEAGRRKAEPCTACHGRDGNATIPTVPSLAGQPTFYTHWQLILYRDGRRRDPQMSPLAAGLSDADIADLAAYYAARKRTPRPTAPVDPGTMAAGERLATVHQCVSCHAPVLPEPRYTPHIAGQPYEYLVKQLGEFKARTRGELETVMATAALPLTEPDIEILARYFASLPPAGTAPRPGGAPR
ncbi:MAG TPA: c-type cytochrome [Methylomirabilota bacterium]|nr:c-type cytochrome [Methylomirabilota bacterium]